MWAWDTLRQGRAARSSCSSSLPPVITAIVRARDEESACASLTELIAAGKSVVEADHQGATPLHYAARRDWPEVCRLLLSHGANPASATRGGYTAAIFGFLPAVAPLLVPKGLVELFRAVRGDNDRLRSLLASSADVSLRDGRGRTPLMEAAWYSNLEGVRLLLAANADAAATDHHGCTCLMVVSLQNNVRLWMDLRSGGYQLNAADHSALTRKQELLALFPWSASLLQLPCGCASPALLAHEPPYALSLAERRLRLRAALPECSEAVAQQRLDRLQRCADDGPERLMEQLDCMRGLVDETEFERAMWDAKACIAGRVVAADRFMDLTHTCALFLHLYPWSLGRRLRAALETWDEGEVDALWPMVDALHSALEALPSAPSRTWFRPLPAHPAPGDFAPGTCLSWSAPVSVCNSLEEALELSPSRCVLEITTTRVRDVAAFSLDFLDDEAVLPFATHLTVAGVFVDGAAADAVPEVVPERSICIVRLVAGDTPERCSSPLHPQRNRLSSNEWATAEDSASQSCSSNGSPTRDLSGTGRHSSPMKPPLHPDGVALSSRRARLSPEPRRGRASKKDSTSGASSPTAATAGGGGGGGGGADPPAAGAAPPLPMRDRNRRLSFTVRKRRLKSLDGQPVRKNGSPPLERPQSCYPVGPTPNAAHGVQEGAWEGGGLRQGSPLSFLHRSRPALQSPMRAGLPSRGGRKAINRQQEEGDDRRSSCPINIGGREDRGHSPSMSRSIVRPVYPAQQASDGELQDAEDDGPAEAPPPEPRRGRGPTGRPPPAGGVGGGGGGGGTTPDSQLPYKRERRRAVVALAEEEAEEAKEERPAGAGAGAGVGEDDAGALHSPQPSTLSQASLRPPSSGGEPLEAGDRPGSPEPERIVSGVEMSVYLRMPTDCIERTSPRPSPDLEQLAPDGVAAAPAGSPLTSPASGSGGNSPGAGPVGVPRRPLSVEPLNRTQLSSPLRFRLNSSSSSSPISNNASPSAAAAVDKTEDRLSVFHRVFRRSNSVSGR